MSAQFLFAALLIAACCSCGGGSDAPIPSDVNLLPLYTPGPQRLRTGASALPECEGARPE
ncbi:unnamed protein product [Effrenium voratum]|nr:unnamed protein product [Effrenium voratum]